MPLADTSAIVADDPAVPTAASERIFIPRFDPDDDRTDPEWEQSAIRVAVRKVERTPQFDVGDRLELGANCTIFRRIFEGRTGRAGGVRRSAARAFDERPTRAKSVLDAVRRMSVRTAPASGPVLAST